MNSLRICSLVFFTFFSLRLFSQVSGVVADANTGKPVKECEVFINNSSISTITNSDGYFELSNVNIGFYDLVIYHEKYEVFKNALQIKSNKAYKLNLSVIPLAEKSKTSKAKQDEEWVSNFNWFRQGFLGSNLNTSLCTILNEKVLSFKREGQQLHAFASEPLIIDNTALGYTIKYYLQSYVATVQSADVQGQIKFDVQTSDDYAQKNTWERNRQISFWGSARHFFQSMANGNYQQQGYDLTGAKGNKLKSDSLIQPSRIEGYVNLDLPELTLINYLINSDITGMQSNASRGQTSTITRYGSIDVSPDGIPLNSASIKIEGELNKDGLALMIPINYSPETSIEDEKLDWQNFALLQEKAYIHTDRDYYYPRETIWFKAYLGFSMPILRDTLSRLLYVDFISPSGKILFSKNLKIRNGIGWGQFVLPPTMDEGEYYIRAYTNWMRNYKDNIYVRPIPILGWNQNLQNGEVVKSESNYSVAITTDKSTYATREKLSLNIDVRDQFGKSVPGNFSISVVDAEATTKIPQVAHILTPGLLSIDEAEIHNKYFESIEHFMERGISFSGRVVDNKNNNVAATVDIVQGNMDNLINMETDANGEFLVTGLDFSDSLNFAFKSLNEKGKMFGKVEILPKEKIRFDYNKPKLKLEYRSDDALQRVQNTYDLDKNTIMLGEVVITDKAIKVETKLMPKVYGKPDYTVNGSEMRGATAGSNPLIALQGRVPGLRVTEYLDDVGMRHTSVKIRGGTSSMAGNTDPLIMVDGLVWGSPDDLMSLSPSSIDYVEVITRGVSTFGSRGANGVIAIYTKQSVASQEFSLDYMTRKIGGYSRAFRFSHPDYGEKEQDSNPDFRTTIFWNPYLTVSAEKPAEVQFYSADVETKYKITVEGMTIDGQPFRGESYITIAR